MESLFTHLGINWKLLIAQGVNFFVLIFLLNFFLYKPLIKLLKDRQGRIKEGLENANLAERRLAEADAARRAEVARGEREANAIMERANKAGEEYRERAKAEAEGEMEAMKSRAEELGRRLIQREMNNLENRSRELVEKAILEAVGLHPKEVDEKLIEDAVKAVKKLKA